MGIAIRGHALLKHGLYYVVLRNDFWKIFSENFVELQINALVVGMLSFGQRVGA